MKKRQFLSKKFFILMFCASIPLTLFGCGGCGGDGKTDDVTSDEMTSCPIGLTPCGDMCVDIRTDRTNCGYCFNVCGPDAVCENGFCVEGCGGGLVECPDGCKDITSDPNNCGGCGTMCPGGLNATAGCVGSVCTLECIDGFWDLDDVPGCEYACTFHSVDEICNGIDDNCNFLVDEGFQCGMGATVACETSCGSMGSGTCGVTCMIPTGEDCPPPEESCNGMDDDCDDLIDEDFDCALGTVFPCTTACGSSGSGLCQPGCDLPTELDCTPPMETCNAIDDDCDTLPDNGYDCVMGEAGACTSTCGVAGTRTCMDDCRWNLCCAPEEVCFNACDDDCDGAFDEDCGPTPPANDTCDGATNVSTGGIFRGSTSYARDNSSGCGGSAGGDVYFYFDLVVASDVFVNSYTTAWNTLLYASTTCGNSDLGCNDDGQTAQSELHLSSLPAGRYFVALDGFSAADVGDYTLEIYMSPDAASGDRCGSPILITGSVTGNTCSLAQDVTGSCAGSGKDIVYYFVVPSSRSVSFSTCSSASTYDTVLHMRDQCNNVSSEIACSDDVSTCLFDSTLSEITATVGPGIYYLFVDGWGTNCGAYRIETSGL